MYNSVVGVRNRCKPFKSVSCPERAFYLTKIEGESDGSGFTLVEPIRYLPNLDEHDDLKVGFLMLKEVMSQGDVDSVTKLRHSDMYYKDLDIATSSNGDKDGMLTPFCIFFPTHTSA